MALATRSSNRRWMATCKGGQCSLFIGAAVGGNNVSETVGGLQRFPINLRYPREARDSLKKLCTLPSVTPRDARVVLSHVAELRIGDGPPMRSPRTSGRARGCRLRRHRPGVRSRCAARVYRFAFATSKKVIVWGSPAGQ